MVQRKGVSAATTAQANSSYYTEASSFKRWNITEAIGLKEKQSDNFDIMWGPRRRTLQIAHMDQVSKVAIIRKTATVTCLQNSGTQKKLFWTPLTDFGREGR